MQQTFRDLANGAEFIFASERDGINGLQWSGARGPWIKLSARRYCHKTAPAVAHTVGTIRAHVYSTKEATNG